jgi:hypothetical protein
MTFAHTRAAAAALGAATLLFAGCAPMIGSEMPKGLTIVSATKMDGQSNDGSPLAWASAR